MKKIELIYTIFEKLKVSSDDTDLSEELVSSLIDATRATLIKNTYGNKGWNLPVELKQELCLTLEPVSKVDGLSCFGTILRSAETVPQGISFKGSDGAILKVKLYDRESIAISVVPIERLPMIGHNPYTAGMIYAAIDVDRKIYLVSGSKKHSFLEAIKVEGIYEYPDKVVPLGCKDYGSSTLSKDVTGREEAPVTPLYPCEPWEEDYPLEASMQDSLVDIIVKGLVASMTIPEDKINNSTDDRTAG
tara:strand:- start:527 stop:1267 length:741 start_codon:yes stop_codon:yes gene_type:complete